MYLCKRTSLIYNLMYDVSEDTNIFLDVLNTLRKFHQCSSFNLEGESKRCALFSAFPTRLMKNFMIFFHKYIENKWMSQKCLLFFRFRPKEGKNRLRTLCIPMIEFFVKVYIILSRLFFTEFSLQTLLPCLFTLSPFLTVGE